MNKIYLAGSCSSENRTTMVKIANILRAHNLQIYCPWELKIEQAWSLPQEKWARQVFDSDIAAINNCDTFFFISKGRMSSAGSNFEQGYAFATKKPCIVLQITEEPTSLMTFCGTTYFYNCLPSKILEKVEWIASFLEDKEKEPIIYNECRTTLT